jgi:hypothetical protein
MRSRWRLCGPRYDVVARWGNGPLSARSLMMWTRFLPVFLAWYRAWSAVARNSTRSRVAPADAATPMETVMPDGTGLTGPPPGMAIRGIAARSRSVTWAASAAPMCGRRMANSSPPNRPTMSSSRSSAGAAAAMAARTASPARCP